MNPRRSTRNIKKTRYSALNADILYHLCQMMYTDKLHGLVNLSMIDKCTRTVATPFIFDSISSYWLWGKDSESRTDFKRNVEILLKNNRIISSIRTFDLYVPSTTSIPIPSAAFILLTLPRLVKLSIHVHDQHLSQFKIKFEECSKGRRPRSPFPPSLRSLDIPNENWIFLIDSFSHLEYLVVASHPCLGYEVNRKSMASYLQKLGTLHPGLRTLHCPLSFVADNIKEIARCLPDLSEIGLRGRVSQIRYRGCQFVARHIADFKMLPKLETIFFSDLPVTWISDWEDEPDTEGNPIPTLGFDSGTEEFLQEIEERLLTEDGPRLKSVIVGPVVYEVDENRRLMQSSSS
ncbi:hypothetical protein FRC19_009365 [Serendipita sp. 401]|nr:hypothetical protein FRC19_009365 [Serendipita sp. 401]